MGADIEDDQDPVHRIAGTIATVDSQILAKQEQTGPEVFDNYVSDQSISK